MKHSTNTTTIPERPYRVVSRQAPDAPVEQPAVRTKVRVPLTLGDGYETVADLHVHGTSDGAEHLALGMGDYASNPTPLVRPHSECLTGDVPAATAATAVPAAARPLERTSEVGGFVLSSARRPWHRLYNKLDAYALQDAGLDTYDANRAVGFEDDQRDYTAAAEMLRALGVHEIELLTNNPEKSEKLIELGIDVREVHPTTTSSTRTTSATSRRRPSAPSHAAPARGRLASRAGGARWRRHPRDAATCRPAHRPEPADCAYAPD